MPSGTLFHYVDTATDPVTGARAIVPASINYNADWRVSKDSAEEVILTNITTPLNLPEKLRVAISDVSDVFKGSDIPYPTAPGTTTKIGKSILIQLTGAGTAVDSTIVPFSAHMVLRVPTGAGMAPADLIGILERLLGHLYDTKATEVTTRVAGLLRGVMTPIDL